MSLIDFDAGHRDLITVTKFNFYGNRIVTASSDHRMKVWDLKDDKWQLTDTWRAHDAEILDVRGIQPFFRPSGFLNIGTIGQMERSIRWATHR